MIEDMKDIYVISLCLIRYYVDHDEHSSDDVCFSMELNRKDAENFEMALSGFGTKEKWAKNQTKPKWDIFKANWNSDEERRAAMIFSWLLTEMICQQEENE